jgi:hypothetical protein
MTFRVPVVRIDRYEDHPKNPNSTITYFSDRYFDEFTEVHQKIEYQVVSSRLEDGSPRYKHGDAAIFMKGNSIVPLDYLAFIGYCDDDGKPLFKGGRVKAGNFQTIKSDGILTPATVSLSESGAHVSDTVTFPDGSSKLVRVGDDLQTVLGITEFVGK